MRSITAYVDSRGESRSSAPARVLLEDHAPTMIGIAMITENFPTLLEDACAPHRERLPWVRELRCQDRPARRTRRFLRVNPAYWPMTTGTWLPPVPNHDPDGC